MDNNFKNELKTVIHIIEEYKKELEKLSFQKAGFEKVSSHISQVIQESEEATTDILNATNEAIQETKNILSSVEILRKDGVFHPVLESIENYANSIIKILINNLTKLEFQDIASQRLIKIEQFLEEIEKEVLKLLLLFGISEESSQSKKEELEEKLKELEWKKEVTQSDVDSILEEFGM